MACLRPHHRRRRGIVVKREGGSKQDPESNSSPQSAATRTTQRVGASPPKESTPDSCECLTRGRPPRGARVVRRPSGGPARGQCASSHVGAVRLSFFEDVSLTLVASFQIPSPRGRPSPPPPPWPPSCPSRVIPPPPASRYTLRLCFRGGSRLCFYYQPLSRSFSRPHLVSTIIVCFCSSSLQQLLNRHASLAPIVKHPTKPVACQSHSHNLVFPGRAPPSTRGRPCCFLSQSTTFAPCRLRGLPVRLSCACCSRSLATSAPPSGSSSPAKRLPSFPPLARLTAAVVA